MPIDTLTGDVVPIKLWTKASDLEELALTQLKNTAALPWCYKHVAVMPDVHAGYGVTIGSVIALKDAVSPAAVGIDIGCGMAAVKTNLTRGKIDKKLKQLRQTIEELVPTGFNAHASSFADALDDSDLGVALAQLMARFPRLVPVVQDQAARALAQCGTLGGGNHFIEVCVENNVAKDADDAPIWLMLHSGSRGIGKQLADYHVEQAMTLEHNQGERLRDKSLAVFLAQTPQFEAYWHDLLWAQDYAALNRRIMLAICQRAVTAFWPSATFAAPISCHHNYVMYERHFGEQVYVTRKGAIRAGAGEYGIIPGSMGAKSFIVRGRGNPESFDSASHGAGRRMSRSAANKKYTLEDLERLTAGVECRKDKGVLDEIPAAYKDIEQVMAHQQDLVEVVAELKQVLCVKGGDDKKRGK